MRIFEIKPILLIVLGLFWSGCNVTPPSKVEGADTPLHTYLQQQSMYGQLRQEMSPVVRQISVLVPIDCETAIDGIAEDKVQEQLMSMAAGAGIYAISRSMSSDPRVGLADLTITITSIKQAFKNLQANDKYPQLSPLIATLESIQNDLQALCEKWLPAEALKQIQETAAVTNQTRKAPLRDLIKVNEMLATKLKMPKGIQIESSFIQFDDNGLFERGISELHDMNLAAEKASSLLALMPAAFEFRIRRAILTTLNEPQVMKICADIEQMAEQMKELQQLRGLQDLKALQDVKSLQELQSLRPLKALDDLVEFKWRVVLIIAFGFVAQTLLLVWAIRGKRS